MLFLFTSNKFPSYDFCIMKQLLLRQQNFKYLFNLCGFESFKRSLKTFLISLYRDTGCDMSHALRHNKQIWPIHAQLFIIIFLTFLRQGLDIARQLPTKRLDNVELILLFESYALVDRNFVWCSI